MTSTNLKCIVTGAEKRFTNSLLANKLKKFGTVEVLAKYYVSKEAAQLLRAGNSIEEVRAKLNAKTTGNVDYEVLYKLKLLKKSKRKKAKSFEEIKAIERQTEENERKYFEQKEKMSTCLKTWVEWATGGPNKCQVPYGGTCVRPDVYYDNEHSKDGRCKPCPYHEHCLCTGKQL